MCVTNIYKALLYFAVLLECHSLYAQAPSGVTADSQREGIKAAVKSIEEQVNDLAREAGRTAHLFATHPEDQQIAVVELADGMARNLLLTRTYLALGVAELKLITLHSCAGCISPEEREKYLRHIEAIQFAIDERILESQDLRIFRVLQVGVNQALRQELARLQSPQTDSLAISESVRCMPSSRFPRCGMFWRCFQNR